MKTARIMITALIGAALILTVSCKSSRHVTKDTEDKKDISTTVEADQHEVPDTLIKDEFLRKVIDNAQTGRFLTSKMKFTVEVGKRQMTLTGNLKMKRDDVIRLQLMAFGFVEAARLEFTNEYILIVDRINKQYLRVPYAQLDFLRNSNIDFTMLQALFWNELFQPGKQKLENRQLRKFGAEYGVDNEVVVSLQQDKLSYRWLTSRNEAHIKMTNILYNDRLRGNYQLNWDYDDFKALDRKFFPMRHKVTFTTPEQEVKFDMLFNYVESNSDWETRTVLSGKYRQVTVAEILQRFMSL